MIKILRGNYLGSLIMLTPLSSFLPVASSGKQWLEAAAMKEQIDAMFLLSIHYRLVRD
jgi:hypothetical protein